MKSGLLILLLFFSSFSFSQEGGDTLQVIAIFTNSYAWHDHSIAQYTVMAMIKGEPTSSFISVEYDGTYDKLQDTVLITIVPNSMKYNDPLYHFPNWEPKNNLEEVSIFSVDRKFLEGCETGRGDCNPQTFKRNFTGQKAFALMPCGGTFSTIQLRRKTDKLPVQEVSIERKDCPPFFDVTNLEDGDYYASMMSCGLGGGFILQLRTNSPKKEFPEERITCRCTISSESDPKYNNQYEYETLPEEMTQVPPISETLVNYLTDYDLESDSSGRVTKMIRSHYLEQTTETTTYIYDTQNRLIREDIVFFSNIDTEEQLSRVYRKEQVDFYYDEIGRRVKKVRKVLKGSGAEFVLEDCTYIY